jgi:cofilin
MLYAASKDALRRKLVGIASEVQGTDLSEVAYDVVMDRVAGR